MSKHYAIKCTNCAAPLDILGGGRVNTVTCSYCHSILDMNDHYKVLAKFNDTKRPQGPFKIGMRGNIKGVEWTIIGWIAYRTAEFPAEEWSEFFLYSPTHGYTWLVYENSKVYFSKRVRDFDLLAWQEKKPKTLFYQKGHYLQKEASYLTYIDYVEGELNWVAKFGDKFTTWDYEGVGYQVLNIEKTNEEIEVYHTERLKKHDVYSAFGLPYTQKSKLEKNKEQNPTIFNDEIEKPKYNKLLFPLFFILIFTIVSSFIYKNTILETHIKNNYETNITINSSAFLVAIELSGYKLNKGNIILSLYQEKNKIFEINEKHALYFDKKIKTWSTTSLSSTIYLKLDKGSYRLSVKKFQKDDYMSISIKEHIIRTTYLLPVAILMAILILFYLHQYINLYLFTVIIGILILIYFGESSILFLIPIGIVVIPLLFAFDKSTYEHYEWDDEDD